MDQRLFLDPGGRWGLTPEFFQNLVSEMVGIVVSVILISFVLEWVRSWRDNRRWRQSRMRIAADLAERHRAVRSDLSDAFDLIFEHARRPRLGLIQELRDGLEAATRYYERNVTFLPPKSLANFESYRARFKQLQEQLKDLSVALDTNESGADELKSAIAAFDFSVLDKEIDRFGKSLGVATAHSYAESAAHLNKQLVKLVELPAEKLKVALI